MTGGWWVLLLVLSLWNAATVWINFYLLGEWKKLLSKEME